MPLRIDWNNIGEAKAIKTLSDVLPSLLNVKHKPNGETVAACPYCENGDSKGHHLYLTEKHGYLEMHCMKCETPQKTLLEILAGNDAVKDDLPVYIPKKKEEATDLKLIENIEYIYRNIDGTVAFKKTRKKYSDGSKKFGFKAPSGDWNKPENSICIYGLYELSQLDRNERVYIVEGEKCVEAMRKHGFNAVCSSNGAKGAKVTQEEKNLLSEFFDKVVIPDNDEPGQEYIKLWDNVRVMPLTDIWPDCPKKGDIADYFEAGFSAKAIHSYVFCDVVLPIYIGDKYKITYEGVHAKKKNKNGDEFWVILCPHPIVPHRRFKDVYTNLEKYEVAYYRDKSWKYVNIPANELINGRLLQKHADKGLVISGSNAKDIAEFCKDYISAGLIEGYTKTSSRMGWYNNDFIPYCGSIELDNYGGLNEELMRGVKPIGFLDRWVKAIQPLWKKSPEMCMFLAGAAAAPIVGKLEKDTFVVLVYGKTGYGKTKLLEIAASMFGLPSKNGLVFVMNSTNNYMTKTLHALKNVPMCVDENEARNNSKAYQGSKNPEAEWLYEISSNKGRQRMTSTGEAEEALTWATTMLVTGEGPITRENSPEGAKNRIVEIPISNYITKDFSKIAKTIQSNYGKVAPVLIDSINEIKDLYEEVETRYRKIMALNPRITPKMANNGACIMLAYELLCKIIGQGALTDEQLISYLKTMDDVDNISVTYDAIVDWLARKDSNIRLGKDYEEAHPGELISSHYENAGEILAVKHIGYYTVNKNALNAMLKTEQGTTLKIIQKQLADKGYLMTSESKGKIFYSDKATYKGIRFTGVKIAVPEEILE